MICQEMTNYKEERIVMRNLIYIIFVISYLISLLDFVTSSHVQFLEFNFDFNYIYKSSHSLYAFICMFVLYIFVFIFVIVTTHHFHNVCIHHLAIYFLMNSS